MKRAKQSDSAIRRLSSARQLYVFLGVTFVFSALLEALIVFKARTVNTLLIVPLMWVPGLTAIACSNSFSNQFRDLALVKPGRRSLTLAYLVPAAAAVLGLMLCLLMDVGQFQWPGQSALKTMVLEPTLGVLVAAALTAGEELGWRGFLHTHLARARVPHPVLITSVIWSVWHWPLILWAGYATSDLPWLSLGLFTVSTVSFGIFLGWLRETSKSVAPSVLAHAVHNSWVQTLAPAFYLPGRLSPFFAGESGFILAIIYLGIAIYLYKKLSFGRY